MKKTALDNRESVLRLPFGASDMPHATVETNRTCNIRCACCYNTGTSHVKEFATIAGEIDALFKRRRLQAISILGGEPTLHPDLSRVVSYIKSKRVRCQILTNGIVFLQSGGDELLLRLKKAGTDRIVLHVDRGQMHIHADVEQARQKLFDMMEKAGMSFALSITIDDGERASIPAIVKRYARYQRFDGIIGFMASDHAAPKLPGLRLEGEYRSIVDGLAIPPTAYIPASNDETEVRWLLFHHLVDSRTARLYPISPAFEAFFIGIYRLLSGRYPFLTVIPPALGGICGFFIELTEVLLEPSHAVMHFRHAFTLLFSHARLQYIVFQVPPEFGANDRAVALCGHCPDATMRNGRLMPLCIADALSPLPGDGLLPAKADPRLEKALQYLSCE